MPAGVFEGGSGVVRPNGGHRRRRSEDSGARGVTRLHARDLVTQQHPRAARVAQVLDVAAKMLQLVAQIRVAHMRERLLQQNERPLPPAARVARTDREEQPPRARLRAVGQLRRPLERRGRRQIPAAGERPPADGLERCSDLLVHPERRRGAMPRSPLVVDSCASKCTVRCATVRRG
jgi:hypothetical protein